MYAAGSPPLQPTRAAQLLLDGVKIEPCTIIIMTYPTLICYSTQLYATQLYATLCYPLDFKGYINKEASPKITAQMKTIYVTAQLAPTAGATESADTFGRS
jgi:hypothetical protein